MHNQHLIVNLNLSSLDCWPYKIIYLLDDKAAVPAHLPYMKDYSKPWTDERFYKFFDITDEEKEIIENVIKTHYES